MKANTPRQFATERIEMLERQPVRALLSSAPAAAVRDGAPIWIGCLAGCCVGLTLLFAVAQTADAQVRIRKPARLVAVGDDPFGAGAETEAAAENEADDTLSLNDQERLKKENTQKYAGGASLKTNPELEELMKRAELFAAEQSYRNATLLWQRVLEKSGDSLYTVDGETYYSLAREVERRISKLPVDGMRVYRVGADGETKAIMAQAKSPIDEDALTKIVDNYFLSSLGDKAAFDLGCLALDHYDFVGASRLFNKIITEYPEPSVPMDQVYLRLALATAHIGDEKSAREAIEQARKLAAPESAELVEMIAKNIETFAKEAGVIGRSSKNYEMRLGAMNRTGAMPAPPEDSLATDLTPEWEVAFPVSSTDRGEFEVKIGTRKSAEDAADRPNSGDVKQLLDSWKQEKWLPTGQLLLSDGRMYFRTGNDITAWSTDGLPEKPLWRSLWLNQFTTDEVTKYISNVRNMNGRGVQVGSTGRPETLPQVFFFGDRIHQSMMVDEGVVYAVEGKRYSRFDSPGPVGGQAQQAFAFNASVPRRSRTNFLTAYDARNGKLLWHRAAADPPVRNEPANAEQPDKPAATQNNVADQNVEDTCFMSAPVAYGNLLLCAVSEGGSIWIYGLDKANEGKTVWKSYLCDEPSGGCNPWSPIEIAVEGRDAYVVCGTGAVFGLDAVSGALRFARRYMRDEKDSAFRNPYNPQNPSKDPIGWDDDVVIPFGNALVVMASDHDWLFAIDRRSGEFIWRAPRHPLEDDQVAEYCLGVVNNKMYVAGSRVVICYDLAGDGRLSWVTPLEENSYGRGFVSENGVYMPVSDSIVRLDLNNGKQLKRVGVTLPSGDPVGNLYCDGKRLWVTGLNKVYALTSLKQKMIELDKEIEKGDLGALRERMQLYSQLDRYDEALQDFQRILQHAVQAGSRETDQAVFAELICTNLAQIKAVEILQLLIQHEQSLSDDALSNFQAAAMANKGIVLTAMRTLLASEDAAKVQVILQSSRLLPDLANQEMMAAMLSKVVQPNDVETLKTFIADNPEFSFVALRSLAKELGEDAKPVINGLLGVTSETVRYGAAFELTNLGDRAALMPLVELMESSDPLMRRVAARTLRLTSKQKTDFDPAGDEQQRAEAVKKLRDWVQGDGQTAELTYPLYGTMILRGRTLVCLPNSQKIVEYDLESDKPVWEHKIGAPRSCVGTPDGHRLVACYQNRLVVEIDENEAKVWEYPITDGYPSGVQRLENGNTLIAISGGGRHYAVEVDAEKNIVWSCKPRGNSTVMDAQRLENGNTLIALTSQQQVIEVDPDGKTVWQLSNMNQPYSAQRLENGNTLVAQHSAARVVELDPEGKIVWQLGGIAQPQSAQRLADGHTLVAYQDGWKEVDEDKKVIRQVSGGPVTSIQRY